MTTKSILIGLTIFVLTVATTCLGQVTAERRLADSLGTYSFAAPSGWKSNSNADGFALADPAGKILIAVSRHNYRDFAAFAAEANLERDGLQMIGKPQEIKNGQTFRAAKQTAQGTLVIDTSVLFSPYGGGVLIAAMAAEADANTAFDAGLKIAASVEFTKVPASTGGPSASFLSGKHLLYLFTGNGYSERKDIYLCASGGFYQSTNLGGFTPNNADGGSFGSQSGRHGTWSVNGSTLVLSFNNGATGQYSITKRQASNEVGLNGKRFFVQSQTVCR